MDGPTNVLIAFIVIGLPVIMLMLIANRYFKLREKKLEVEAGMAAEKAAQYAAHTNELEQRVRVLEQIVTDQARANPQQGRAIPRRRRRLTIADSPTTSPRMRGSRSNG